MANTALYDDGEHRNILLEDFDPGGTAVFTAASITSPSFTKSRRPESSA